MPVTLADLERRALELAKLADFGAEAAGVNAAILDLAPGNASALKRLGRCHLEQHRFDEAVAAFRSALALNPTDTIATNLLNEVRKRRALTPNAAERATTGFTAREFALLETLAPEEAARKLSPRIEALFTAINASTIAERVIAARQRRGDAGSKLFHTNSCHAGGKGHIYAFHYGGRWEPQFHVGWFSAPALSDSCLCAGLGFNVSNADRDRDRSGQERVLRHFEDFQRALARSWKRHLADWMGASGGFIQWGSNPPATTLTPERAVEWLISCSTPAAHDWLFVGRWWFTDKPDDAAVLADRAKLARHVDDSFRALFPLWLAAYGDDTPPV